MSLFLILQLNEHDHRLLKITLKLSHLFLLLNKLIYCYGTRMPLNLSLFAPRSLIITAPGWTTVLVAGTTVISSSSSFPWQHTLWVCLALASFMSSTTWRNSQVSARLSRILQGLWVAWLGGEEWGKLNAMWRGSRENGYSMRQGGWHCGALFSLTIWLQNGSDVCGWLILHPCSWPHGISRGAGG